MVEQRIENPRVGSSILPLATISSGRRIQARRELQFRPSFPRERSRVVHHDQPLLLFLAEQPGAMIDQPTSYRDALQDSNQDVDRFEREVLLAHAVERNRAWLWSHLDEPIAPESLQRYQKFVEKRAAGHPVAYLLGYREFYGREFEVSPAVLIPRPETELLVDLAISLLPDKNTRVVDVGTGSGAIGLTLAAERPDWRVALSDLSEAALRIAGRNRDALGLARVELFHCDLLNGLPERRFDLVISNPPYIAEGDPHLDAGDLRFEPGIALSSGHDGLDLIKPLIVQACSVLVPGGWLLLEHGHDQAEAVRSLLDKQGFESVRSWTDLAAIERVSGGQASP